MSDAYVYHPYITAQKLSKDEVVQLEIGLWPGEIIFDAGESMRLEIMGRHPIMPEFETLKETIVNYNVGRHAAHTGGEWQSRFYVALAD